MMVVGVVMIMAVVMRVIMWAVMVGGGVVFRWSRKQI